MKRQTGFTLIELIMVIVILGVLSAVAIPKFVDLSGDAEDAALEGIAGGLSSAAVINYANEKANPAGATAVGDCADAANLIEGGLPTGYTITTPALIAGAEGASDSTCELEHTASGKTTTFTAIKVII